MTHSSNAPVTRLYAIQLSTDPSGTRRLAGRLEHVMSGRRRDFADGEALLACLAEEQARGYSKASGASCRDDDPVRFDAALPLRPAGCEKVPA